LLRIPSTEGRSVCLCWAPLKPTGPKGSLASICSPFYGRACCWAMLGEFKPKGPKGSRLGRAGLSQNLKDLKEAWCVCEHDSLDQLKYPTEDHPLATATHREPSALYCWILEILYCNPKGRRALLRVPSTEGRSVCLCWSIQDVKGLKDLVPGGRVRLCLPWSNSDAPLKHHPLDHHREPYALEGWILQI
jgi:hypothetical protein